MPLTDDIRRQVRAESRLIATVTGQFGNDLTSVLRQTNRRIRGLLRSLEADGGRLVATRAALGRALRLRLELQVLLEDAGYAQIVRTALDEPLDRLTATALNGRNLVARSARLTDLDIDVLDAWRTIREADLLQLGEQAVQGVWRSTLDGVLANRQVDTLVDEIADQVLTTEARARTIYDTAVSTFSRQVDQLGVDPSPDDRFMYVGPNDTETRDFCAGLVGEIRTRAELDSLDNGQLPNTLLTGGGFNCRHKWFFLAGAALEDVAA